MNLDGKTEITFEVGTTFEGIMLNKVFVGNEKFNFYNGDVYIGEIKSGKCHVVKANIFGLTVHIMKVIFLKISYMEREPYF